MQSITILGSTGSIGTSTLDVVARHLDKYRVFALTANSNSQLLLEQCKKFQPDYAVMADDRLADELITEFTKAGLTTTLLAGSESLAQVASHAQVDTVMAAIVGAAGLLPTLAAAESGKRLLLANKESLVMAGDLLMRAVVDNGCCLLPIDSEHNAIFQCLPHAFGSLHKSGVSRVLLTASGGPFRGWSHDQLANVTPEQACAHPNWSMGRKISVDSASLMNKGLELIEACFLFSIGPEQIQVVQHPQSVIHSMVAYVDGSVLAQMGNPDMRTPIAHALAWPERIDSGVNELDLFEVARLDFEPPNDQAFPCLSLARQAIEQGGSAPAILNAANEIAVEAFLERRIRFVDIPVVIERTLTERPTMEATSIPGVIALDQQSRDIATGIVSTLGHQDLNA